MGASSDVTMENCRLLALPAIRRTANPGIGETLMGEREPLAAVREVRFLEPGPEAPSISFGLVHIQTMRVERSEVGMKRTNGRKLREQRHTFDPTMEAVARLESYCASHPGSPSAALKPQLLCRGQLWIALLGPSVEEGIVGIGQTVEAALRAFDAQYQAGPRPPAEPLRRGLYNSRVTSA